MDFALVSRFLSLTPRFRGWFLDITARLESFEIQWCLNRIRRIPSRWMRWMRFTHHFGPELLGSLLGQLQPRFLEFSSARTQNMLKLEVQDAENLFATPENKPSQKTLFACIGGETRMGRPQPRFLDLPGSLLGQFQPRFIEVLGSLLGQLLPRFIEVLGSLLGQFLPGCSA